MSGPIRSLGQEYSTKKNRLRFTYNDDLALLREFVGQNPLSNPEGWEVIKQNMQISTGKAFTIRTIKQHLILIIEIWIKKDEVDKVRSGIEDCSERDLLLQEASVLCKEFNFVGLDRQKKKTPRDLQLSQLGKKVRNSYLDQVEHINENASTSTKQVCNQNQDNGKFVLQEIITCDQENEIFFYDHDYASCVDIGLEPPSHQINNTNTLEINSLSYNSCDKRTLEVISPKKTRGCLESTATPIRKTQSTDQKSSVLGPSRTRIKRQPIRRNALTYLSQKQERDYAIRKKELELEERKIALQERQINLNEEKLKLEKQKLELENEERKQRMDGEKKEKEVTFNILQKLIDTLAQKCNKV
ncbi:uncharacterized protein isoform X1 [Leptinotarsa decemlineata]|uniref:uncharacterized protein isoform X1 n=1 Tax=Leptinotarsa decemlineata TaxID=7539 RepID=UPI003D30D045